MNINNLILYGILALVVVALLYSLSGMLPTQVIQQSNAQAAVPSAAPDSIETGTTDTGDVAIALTPASLQPLTFDLAVNTHSVDLSPFDLKELVSLQYNNNLYKPSSAPSLTAHHSSGTIMIDVSVEKPFTIEIVGIPKVEERIYTWR